MNLSSRVERLEQATGAGPPLAVLVTEGGGGRVLSAALDTGDVLTGPGAESAPRSERCQTLSGVDPAEALGGHGQ